MAFNYDLFDRITDRLVALLAADADLSAGIDAEVSVRKGVRRVGPGEVCVFVFRARVDDWGYWAGEAGTDVEATWALVCVARHQGDPEALEQLVSRLAANLCRVMLKHKLEAGYWTTAQLLGSDAVQFRDDKNQTYEMETVPVTIRFSSSDD